jgi:hypothetical protein
MKSIRQQKETIFDGDWLLHLIKYSRSPTRLSLLALGPGE